ncbi:MAG: T9SS type A sorting domain-containing protein [Bacteroidetes bacterium]|nr:T9SS type A sorting domain-containing protein [Bacteroidota bacterium]
MTVTDSFGCINTTQKRLMVLPNPTANAGSDMAICNGTTTRLLGAGGMAYKWSPSAFMDDSLIANPKVNPSTTIQYILSVKNVYGCESFDTTEVKVLQLPHVAIGSDLNICFGQQNAVPLNPIPFGGLWNRSEVDSNHIFTPISTGTYKLIYTFVDTNKCVNSDTLIAHVVASPDVHIQKADFLCIGDVLHLRATIQHAGGILWQSKVGGQFEFVNQPITDYTPDSSEVKNQKFIVYAITINNGFCQPDLDSAIISIKSLPAKPTIQQSGLFLLSSPAAKYHWYLNSNLLNGEVNQVLAPNVSGVYSVVVFDTIGCMQKSDEVGFFFSGFQSISTQQSFSIYPNPNNGHFNVIGNSDNDDLKTIVVYDLLGKEVYRTKTNQSNFEMEVNQLIDGIYYMHILTDKLTTVGRFTIER